MVMVVVFRRTHFLLKSCQRICIVQAVHLLNALKNCSEIPITTVIAQGIYPTKLIEFMEFLELSLCQSFLNMWRLSSNLENNRSR